jgi:predicted site-specific integrase-resolvase
MVELLQEPVVKPKQAAKVLKVSTCTIYRWKKRGWIGYIELPSGGLRIKQSSINAILAGR